MSLGETLLQTRGPYFLPQPGSMDASRPRQPDRRCRAPCRMRQNFLRRWARPVGTADVAGAGGFDAQLATATKGTTIWFRIFMSRKFDERENRQR